MEAATASNDDSRAALVRWGKRALLALGIFAIAWVVASTGPRRVLDALLDAAPWMPFIVLLDAFYFVGESLAHRTLMGEQALAIPRAVFVRTVLSSYALSVLAPLGRAGVEVSRVAAYGRWVGSGRAAAASALVHAVSAFANALLCLAAAAASAHALGVRHPLTLTLLALTAGLVTLAATTAFVMRRSKVGQWIGARVPRLAEAGRDLDQALRDSPASLARAATWCSASRASQVVQAALLILAVGGVVTPTTALVSQGIHIVGSTFGEAIPGQTGVVEASYRIFADGLGFGADPARAVAIALLCRLSQILVASTSLVLLAMVPALRGDRSQRSVPSRTGGAATQSGEDYPGPSRTPR
jgi:hypothetical protein